jgi:hypothetical protein
MSVQDTAQGAVERLIDLTERLTERLAVDSHAFEVRRPHEAAERLEETSRLANVYRHEVVRVRSDPTLVARAPREQRYRLEQASEAFEAVLARHGRALFAAREVTEGVVRAIAEEVASSRQANAGYGPGARAPKSAAATAITLNQQA